MKLVTHNHHINLPNNGAKYGGILGTAVIGPALVHSVAYVGAYVGEGGGGGLRLQKKELGEKSTQLNIVNLNIDNWVLKLHLAFMGIGENPNHHNSSVIHIYVPQRAGY